MPVTRTDYGALLDADLPHWLGPKLRAFMRALGTSLLDGAEDVIAYLIDSRTLDQAEGVWLDQYGAIAGVAREGLDDDEYRLLVGVRLEANRSEGVPLSILRVVAQLLPDADGSIVYRNGSPGTAEYVLEWEVSTALTDSDWLDRVRDLVEEMTPAGVSVRLIEGDNIDDGPFRYDSGLGYDEGKLAAATRDVT